LAPTGEEATNPFTYPWEQIAKAWAWFMNLWVQTAKTEGAVYKSESADRNSWQGRAVRVDSASPKEMLALHLLIPRVLLIHHIINCVYFIFYFSRIPTPPIRIISVYQLA